VVGVHLVGGLVGSLLLGLFADKTVNEFGYDGLFFGGGAELLNDQFVASISVLVFSLVVTLIIGKLIDLVIGLRVSEDDEESGLDLSQHAETAYNLV
jgi:ammonium transporter, Amt family